MEAEEWRLTVALGGSEGSVRLLKRLREDRGLAETGCSLSGGSGTLFAYGSSKESVEQAATVVRFALDELDLTPSRIEIDCWIAAEARWGDPTAPRPAPGEAGGEGGARKKSGWLSSLVDGLMDGMPGL